MFVAVVFAVTCLGLTGLCGLGWKLAADLEAEREQIRVELQQARDAGDVQAERAALIRLRDSGPATREEGSRGLAELELAQGRTDEAANHVLDLILQDPSRPAPADLMPRLGAAAESVHTRWFEHVVRDDRRITRLPFAEAEDRWAVAIELADARKRGEDLARAAGDKALLVVAIKVHGGRSAQGRQLEWVDTFETRGGKGHTIRTLPIDDPHSKLIPAVGADPTFWYFYAARADDSVATERHLAWLRSAEYSDLSATLQMVDVVRTEKDFDGDEDLRFIKERVEHLPDEVILAYVERFQPKEGLAGWMSTELQNECRRGFDRVKEARGL